ncbi:MAG TPA: hypothetical protein VFN35_36635, partial [Ktedonobacteraceae bacterium]|nr:hypothetical protein [Ktedonobacteraceae bacterium]
MADQVPLLPYNLYQTEPPRLPLRPATDDGGPEFLTQAHLKEQYAGGVTLQGQTNTGDCLSVSLSFVADGIARVLLESPEEAAERVRLAHDLSIDENEVNVQLSDEKISLSTPSLRIEVTLQPFHMAFYGADGRLLLSQNYTELTNVRMKLTLLPFGLSKF